MGPDIETRARNGALDQIRQTRDNEQVMRPAFPWVYFCLVFIMITVIFLYPLSVQMNASVYEKGDSLLNVYLVHWAGTHFGQGLDSYFRATIFYPDEVSLRFSEHFLGLALPSLILQKLGFNPVFIHNFLLLVSFPLTALFMARLAFLFFPSLVVSFVTGFFLAFSPLRFGELERIQVLWSFWVVCALWLGCTAITKGQKRYFLAFGLACWFQQISGTYFLLFLPVALTIWLISLVIVGGRDYLKQVVWLFVSLLAAGLASIPIHLPYYRMHQQGFTRSWAELERYAFHCRDLITTVPYNLVYGDWLGAQSSSVDIFFLGLVPTILIISGCFYIVRRPHNQDNRNRVMLFSFLIMAVFTFIFSTFWGAVALRHVFPPFSGIRAVFRWNILTSITLGLFLARGLYSLTGLQTKFRSVVIWFVIVMCGLEYISVPVPHYETPVDSAVPSVYRFLERNCPPDSLVELPLYLDEQDFSLDVIYTYFGCYHDHHLVNGYSGHFPAEYLRNRRILNEFPSIESLALLQKLGVTRVLVHTDLWPENRRASLEHIPLLEPYRIEYRDQTDLLLVSQFMNKVQD
ncbi:hypothetical protein JXQ70_15985 [bacterium]|nr:hypothetical protein [bacterium]